MFDPIKNKIPIHISISLLRHLLTAHYFVYHCIHRKKQNATRICFFFFFSSKTSSNHLHTHLDVSSRPKKKRSKNSHKQLQKVLSEFDFLHDLDHPQPQQQAAHQQSRPAHVQMPSTPPILQQRPQIILSADIYHRPVMSMPPVILMGGPVCDGGTINYIQSSMPSSPIVEMPPSPAPSSMMYIEFPGDEIDEINIVQNIVEVRVESIFCFLFLLLFLCFASLIFFFFFANFFLLSLVIHLFSFYFIICQINIKSI